MEAFGMVILFALVAIVLIVLAHLAASKRKQALQEVGRRLGLEFVADCHDAHCRYAGFAPFDRGRSRRSSNLLHGERAGIQWEIFDYRFRTGSGKNAQTHHHGIVAAAVPIVFRKLIIRPEGFFDRIAQMVGFDDINFESEAFSRRFHVSCDVRKYAYDVIHPQMIDYLMMQPAFHWQLAGNVILIHRNKHFSPEQIEQVIAMVQGFVQRIPEYVRQDAHKLYAGASDRA